VFVQVRGFREGGQGGALASPGRQDQNFGIACVRKSRCENGRNALTQTWDGKREGTFCQIELDISAREFQVSYPIGLRRINGQVT
jgi:hypothetical protein